jgi:hypothetical protein
MAATERAILRGRPSRTTFRLSGNEFPSFYMGRSMINCNKACLCIGKDFGLLNNFASCKNDPHRNPGQKEYCRRDLVANLRRPAWPQSFGLPAPRVWGGRRWAVYCLVRDQENGIDICANPVPIVSQAGAPETTPHRSAPPAASRIPQIISPKTTQYRRHPKKHSHKT